MNISGTVAQKLNTLIVDIANCGYLEGELVRASVHHSGLYNKSSLNGGQLYVHIGLSSS